MVRSLYEGAAPSAAGSDVRLKLQRAVSIPARKAQRECSPQGRLAFDRDIAPRFGDEPLADMKTQWKSITAKTLSTEDVDSSSPFPSSRRWFLRLLSVGENPLLICASTPGGRAHAALARGVLVERGREPASMPEPSLPAAQQSDDLFEEKLDVSPVEAGSSVVGARARFLQRVLCCIW